MQQKRPIYEYREFLKDRYGEVLQRIPLDPGFSCPNRNRDGSGGCSFCGVDGGRAPQLKSFDDLYDQIEAGVRFARRRYGNCGLMAYLQAYTSTFGNPHELEGLARKILSYKQFRAITFGTRPDCISAQTLDMLTTLNQSLDVWVELGIQTSHNETLKRINRGHTFQQSEDAIHRLHSSGLSVATHLILGLPGEDLPMMQETIERLNQLPVQGIKLHNLHILKDTVLEEEFARAPFPLFNENEYMELLLQLLQWVPADRPLLRLTTDSPETQLVAPRWNLSKGKFLKNLKNQMILRGIFQGMKVESEDQTRPETIPLFSPVSTEDGSLTFYSDQFKEHFHSKAGARSEAIQKYCEPAGLVERLKKGPVRLLDICFGLGYNSLVSCEEALRVGGELTITALEMDRRVVQSAAAIPYASSLFNYHDCLEELVETGSWTYQGCTLQMIWGDARQTITQLKTLYDLIWLDGFSTQRNSELWTVDFFKKLKQLLAKNGVLCTYCAAIPVRRGFMEAGFHVGESPAFGRERGGTVASHDASLLPQPLPERDIFLMQGSRGIPYRDPDANRSNREILRARQNEILLYKRQQEQQKKF